MRAIRPLLPAWIALLCRASRRAMFLVLAIAAPASAQTPVDLQLVLAVDASGSVDQIRFELQKRGYMAAFRHARVLQAIRSGPHQAIAVTMMQWTGPMLQVQVVGWTLVGDQQTAAAFAAAIERRTAPAVQRRHLDQRRHRLRDDAVSQERVARIAARHRRLRRRLQQSRTAGHRRPRRGGRCRGRDQRLADPCARAGPRPVLLR